MKDILDAFGPMYEKHGEKLRYLITGVFNTAFGYMMFLAALALSATLKPLSSSPDASLALLGRNYFLIAQWGSWVLSVPVGTTTMKYFAFRSPGRLLHEIGRAYFVYLPGVGLSSLILWVAVRLMHMPPALGQVVTIAFATVFSYVGHKYFTFRRPHEDADRGTNIG